MRMRVIVHDPIVTPEQIEKAGFESVSLDELYGKADYITIHVPKMKKPPAFSTRRLFQR